MIVEVLRSIVEFYVNFCSANVVKLIKMFSEFARISSLSMVMSRCSALDRLKSLMIEHGRAAGTDK